MIAPNECCVISQCAGKRQQYSPYCGPDCARLDPFKVAAHKHDLYEIDGFFGPPWPLGIFERTSDDTEFRSQSPEIEDCMFSSAEECEKIGDCLMSQFSYKPSIFAHFPAPSRDQSRSQSSNEGLQMRGLQESQWRSTSMKESGSTPFFNNETHAPSKHKYKRPKQTKIDSFARRQSGLQLSR